MDSMTERDSQMLATLPYGVAQADFNMSAVSLDGGIGSGCPCAEGERGVIPTELFATGSHTVQGALPSTISHAPPFLEALPVQPTIQPYTHEKHATQRALRVPQHRNIIHSKRQTQHGDTQAAVVKRSGKRLPHPAGSRDTARGSRASLAATHPSNYSSSAPQTMPPPQLPWSRAKHVSQLPTPESSTSASPKSITPRVSSAGPPWRQYTDPMWQTSMDPNFWGNSCTILKSDSSLEHGNVTSPTWMVGLPCGGMTEMGHHYACAEMRLEGRVDADHGTKN